MSTKSFFNQYDGRFQAPQKYSDETLSYLAWALGLYVVALVAVALVMGILQSSGGPSASDHPTALPAGVAELDASHYLIFNRSPAVSTGSVCWDTDNNGASVYEDHYVPSGHLTVLQCAVDQHWNVHKPVAPDLTHVLARDAQNPAYFGTVGVVLALILIPGLFMAQKDRRAYHREIKRYKAGLEDIRREIRAGFANGDLDEGQMLAGLNRLYGAGVKPERDAELPKEIKAIDSYGA